MSSPQRTLMEIHEGENKKISFSIDVGGGKKLRLIDISTEDDYLIASTLFDSLEDLRLSVTLDSTNVHENLNSLRVETSLAAQNAAGIQQQSERKLLSSDSMEPGRPSYLRKSLAWDSAFFTNAGVLDPDELLLVNKGFKSRPLRGIQEDVHMWRSESGSTIYGDDLKFEGFEGDPFEDVRASIQRSSKMFDVVNASCPSASKPAGLKNGQVPKKVDIRSRMKCAPVFEQQSISFRTAEKSKNEGTSRSGERHRLPLKPPKVSGQVKAISTGQSEWALMGKKHDRVIIEEKSAGKRSVQSLAVCKKFSSSVSSPAKKYSDLSRSSYNSPRKAVSPDVPSNHLKRKTEFRKSKLSASVSTSKTPLRYYAKSKRSGNLSLSTQSLPMSNHSSAQYTPASSIDVWTLVPGRKKTSNDSKPNPDSSAAKARTKCPQNGSGKASDLQSNLHSQASYYEGSELSSPLQLNTECVRGTCAGPAESVERFKRSGLRMPSPKIGFFDEDKPVGKKVRGCMHLQLEMRSASPKKRDPDPLLFSSSHSGRKKPAKLTKLGTAEAGNAPSHRKVRRDSAVESGFVRNLPDTASDRYIDTPRRIKGENCFKSRKIGCGEHDRRKVCQSFSLRMEERRPERISSSKLNKEGKVQKAKGSIPHGKETEKRKSSNNGAKVNELSIFLEAIDLNREIVMERAAKNALVDDPLLRQNTLHNQVQDLPNTLTVSTPLPFTEVILSSRTPLGDKTSVCNRSGTYELFMDSPREKSADKHQMFSPFEDIDKENS